jgi:hypothetical protein
LLIPGCGQQANAAPQGAAGGGAETSVPVSQGQEKTFETGDNSIGRLFEGAAQELIAADDLLSHQAARIVPWLSRSSAFLLHLW